jgi:addiction module HigA family antidote
MSIHNPVHPGAIVKEILFEEGPQLSITDIAQKLKVNRTTLSRLINGHSGISADMALRLSKLLPNTDITFWLKLQLEYDIWVAAKHSRKIKVKPLKAA